MNRKFWAAGDGNGGYDIGEGDFTVASVRNIRKQDGHKVAKAYEVAQGREFDPRATAMLFKESPAMAEALRRILQWIDAGCDPSRKSLGNAREILARIDAEGDAA